MRLDILRKRNLRRDQDDEFVIRQMSPVANPAPDLPCCANSSGFRRHSRVLSVMCSSAVLGRVSQQGEEQFPPFSLTILARRQLGKGTPERCKLLGAELEVRGRRKHLIWIADDGSRPWHSPTPVIVANACAAGSRGSPPIAAQLLKRTGAGPGGPNEHCLPRRHWGAVAWPDGYRISIRGVRWIGSRSY